MTALKRPLALSLLATYAASLLLLLTLSACNTTKGFGQDIDSLGQSISGSAKRHGARP
jgi:predicted small secreted protein